VRAPLAITVIAGRWGAGKSAVVDRVARALPDGSVVLCDALDDHAHTGLEVVHVEHEVIEGERGRTIGALRSDLLEAVDDLLARRRRPQHVLIEAVAGSDVPLIAQTFLHTARLRAQVRIGGLVAVVDGHAVATAEKGHPAAAHASLDLEAVAMADLVVVNRLERLLPAVEQRTAWDLWSRNAAGQLHIDVPTERDDPLPRRVLGLAGFALGPAEPPPARLGAVATVQLGPSGPAGLRHAERILDGGSRPIRHSVIELTGALRRDALDAWLSDLHDEVGEDLLRWRGDFVIDGERRRWLGQGVRTSVEVDDGPPVTEAVSRVELVGRTPAAGEVAAALAACAP
jgi:G3E family GTPase